MRYIEKILLPDERLVDVATLHWIIFIPGMVLTASGGIIGYYRYAVIALLPLPSALPYIADKVVAGISFVLAVAGLALLVGAFIRQSATELAITNKRLIAKYGYISRTTFEIMLNRVTGVNFDQSILGRMLNYGTILVHGAGGDISPFDGVSNPQLFQRSLMDIIEHSKM